MKNERAEVDLINKTRELLGQDGIVVTLEQAKLITEFLLLIAEMVVDDCLKA
jgi:hypothetical protein